ncbi:unnamed protein product [Bursaphelenchus xylophilus]|uniref:Galactosylgalactosylxylosylprotein 3-beta-glucuronosyltransferase n=1 Tax=Bursaphelenchus xylophilus TaxID=6326 RepID=A0A811LZI8_BURXY|nr:unnamed protein product [Bursaphelenchus xylophilus]CAG9124057.1 unnamed protein product [Bursaphelenchus xylophilus]
MHVKNIHWLVIEDANETYPLIDKFLKKTGIKYTYLHTTNRGLPCRGWAQRNLAFEYLRQHRNQFGKNDVIYFADDDNAYNYRIFDDYIRKVTRMGVWAVGTSGSTYVESPVVEEGKVVGFHVMFRPERKYATDMSGFALNIDVLLNSNATFNLHCAGTVPEECFLRQVNVPYDQLEPFGYGTREDKEIYVWHRRTAKAHVLPWPTNGYAIEEEKIQPRSCDRLRNINHVTYEEIKLLSELGDD